MNTFEITVMVEDNGRVRAIHVPFAPGTEVEVTISPTARSAGEISSQDETAWAAARDRMREVLAATRGFRNSPLIAREELHERGILR